ncbi:MAG: oligosaccharide repeat unit polymerase [Chitinophagales bacterium]|nr:oligosaccharide repeat unit polymerase [Chitinophagales bacterium]
MINFLFYVPLFLMSFLGSIFIVLKVDHHYIIDKIYFDKTRVIGWVAIMYTMLMLPIGVIIAKKLFNINNTKLELINYAKKPVVNLFNNYEIILKSFLVALSFVSLIAIAYTFIKIDTIPILRLLNGATANELAILRIMSKMEFQGNVLFRNIFALQLMPIITYISFAYLYKTKSLFNYFWFSTCFFASILILTYDLEKSPMAMFLAGFIFFFVWVKGEISIGKLSIISITLFSIIVLFYIGFGQNNISDILFQYNQGISGRVLFSQIAGTFLSFEFFDNIKDFISINSLTNYISYFEIEYSERAAKLIMEVINPKGVILGTAGVQNTLFIGEAWANFGVLGLLLSPIYVGFIIGTFFYSLLYLPKSPIFIGIYVAYSYKLTLIGGFNDYIYNISNLLFFIIFATIILFSYKLTSILQKYEKNNISPSI